MELAIPESVTTFKGGVFISYHKLDNFQNSKDEKMSQIYTIPEDKQQKSVFLTDLDTDSNYLVCFLEQMDENGRPLLRFRVFE